MILKVTGEEYKAKEEFNRFRIEFGKYELEMERVYDQQMCISSLSRIFNVISENAKDKDEPIIFQQ